MKLPPEYQYKLVHLIPQVDRTVDVESGCVRYFRTISIGSQMFHIFLQTLSAIDSIITFNFN